MQLTVPIIVNHSVFGSVDGKILNLILMEQGKYYRVTNWILHILAITAILIGGYWFIAWVNGSATQLSAQGLATGTIVMKTNMALCQLLAGFTLLFIGLKNKYPLSGRMATIFASVVFLIGILTLMEHILNINLGIDQLLVKELSGATDTSSPNRMGFIGALSLALIGIALLLILGNKPKIASWIAIIVLLIVLVPAMGYLLDIRLFFNKPLITDMAWPSLIALSALGFGLILANPDEGIVAKFLSNEPGGILVRKLLPSILLVPLIVGFLVIKGYHLNLFDFQTGIGVLIILMILLLVTQSLLTSQSINKESHIRRIAEKELKESEKRLNALVGASSDVLYRMNSDWSEMLQLSSKSFLSNTESANPDWLKEYIHPDDQPDVTAKIKEAIKNKSIFEFEHRVIQSDGNLGWTHSRAVPILDKDGEIIEWFGAANDITSRKRAEEALIESEKKFSSAFRSNPNAIVLSRKRDGLILDVNDAFLNLIQRSSNEIIGLSTISIGMYDNVEDRKRIIELLNKDGRIADYEVNIKRKSGEVRTVLLSAEQLQIGNIEAMITTIQDMTERKILENESIAKATEIEAIMSSSADGIIVFDKIGRFIRFNSAAEKLLCLHKHEADLSLEKRFAIGMRLITEDGRVLSIDETPAFRSYAKGETLKNQMLHFHGCGDPKWLNISSAPLIISGTHSGAVVTFSDITHIKLYEKDLLDNQKRLQELIATKDKLFSIISHDLRSPFTTIIGFTELLIDKVKRRDIDEILTYSIMIRESSWTVMALLTNLIEWSRMQSGSLNVNPTNFDLTWKVREAFDLMKPLAEKKAISLKVSMPATLPVFADSSMISTVIRNLVSNAIKFTPKSGKIVFSAIKDKNSVIFEVKDNGIGMTKDVAEKIFNNGSNISTPGTEKETGTGLGLIICKEFISKHGGYITVESEIGKGSRFKVTIPREIKK